MRMEDVPKRKSRVGDVEALLVVGECQPVGLREAIGHGVDNAGGTDSVHLIIHLGRGSEALSTAIARVSEPDGAVDFRHCIIGAVEGNPEPVVRDDGSFQCLKVDALNETALCFVPLLAYEQTTLLVQHQPIRHIARRGV